MAVTVCPHPVDEVQLMLEPDAKGRDVWICEKCIRRVEWNRWGQHFLERLWISEWP